MLDWSATDALLKERYSFDAVARLGWRKFPLFMLLKKDFNAGGYGDKVPVEVTVNPARSVTFSSAQSIASAGVTVRRAFEVTCSQEYGIAQISGKMVKATRNNELAFLQAIEAELDSTMDAVLRAAEIKLFRDGYGLLCQIASVSSGVITLTNKEDAHLFEVGQMIGATTAYNAAARSGSGTITAVDRDAGTITYSGTITGIAANDYLFFLGDFTTSSRVNICGLQAWCPASAPTSGDSFFGVDRSIDPQRLAGTRYDATANSENIDEALVNAQSAGAANGAMPRYCFLNPKWYRRLVNLLGSKKEFEFLPAQGLNGPLGDIGFQSIKIYGDVSVINVLPHPWCPPNYGFMLDPDQARVIAYGEFPAVLADDNNRILRVYNADAYEVRLGGYPQFVTQRPDSIVSIKLA